VTKKKGTTKANKKKGTKAKESKPVAKAPVVALTTDQKLAILEEAIERVPAWQGTELRPATTWELMQFAKWWQRQGLGEVMQFAEVITATNYAWKVQWYYSTGQLADELLIEHGTAVTTPKWRKFGSRFFGGVEYNLADYPDTAEAVHGTLKCLKDWRRMLSASGNNSTPHSTNEKKDRQFVWCLTHKDDELRLLAAALNGRPAGKTRLEITKAFLAKKRDIANITNKQAEALLKRLDQYEWRRSNEK
jgi:hypothetical protein